MKGKNRPSRRHKKKQTNIIEEKKPQIKERIKEEVRRGKGRERERGDSKGSGWCIF
jgi:U3 small nucleolar RNA-associated protein 7